MPAEWKVANLEYTITDGKPDKVIAARYTVTERSVDGEYIDSGRVEFPTSHPINNVPFDNLQEQAVIGHIKSMIGGQQVSAIEVRAAQRLSEKVNPTKGIGLPAWGGDPAEGDNARGNPNQ